MSTLVDLIGALAGAECASDLTPKCARCGEHAVKRVGADCAECHVVVQRERRVEALRVARESMPPVFRDLDAQEVRKRACIPERALEQARVAIARPRVVLVGASGLGKTTLACWMLGRVLEAGLAGTREDFERARWAKFVDAPRLCRAVLEHPLGHGEAPMLAGAHRASVLVLDDVGQELDTRMPSHPVVDVIRERHAAGRTTWVTTFLTPAEFEKAYGSGTARRVFDGAAVIGIAETP